MNAAMVAAVSDLENVTVRDLYEEYPDFHIDVQAEQQLLREHDVFIWQHPFFWYSTPAILKEWLDVVLEYGFAYGEGGTALRGKKVMSAITAGGTEEDYSSRGAHRHTIRDLLAPFDQTAHLCGMEYLAPFVLHGVHHYDADEIQRAATLYRRRVADLIG